MDTIDTIRRFIYLAKFARVISEANISSKLKYDLLLNPLSAFQRDVELTGIQVSISDLRGPPDKSVPMYVEMLEEVAHELGMIDLNGF